MTIAELFTEYLEHLFAGSRMLTDKVRVKNFDVDRKQIATVMKRMGLEAPYRRPNTSRKHHPVYPHLLRGWLWSGRTRSWPWTSPSSG